MRLIKFAAKFFVLLSLPLACEFPITQNVCKSGQVDSRNIDSFKDCTKIDGDLIIRNETFTGSVTISKMDPSELEVFSTVKEITGLLSVAASHPDFTDLRYFRNLETIGDMESLSGLYITGTSLKSFGLRSLKRISGVIHIYENHNLCFTEGINWNKLKNKSELHEEKSRPKDACLADNMVCHKTCAEEDGCWGPGPEECLSCKRVFPEGTCPERCSYPILCIAAITVAGFETCVIIAGVVAAYLKRCWQREGLSENTANMTMVSDSSNTSQVDPTHAQPGIDDEDTTQL